jgi:signal transduction histidine kinase
MGETEMIIFLVLINIVVAIFITGIIVFILKYRKRKIIYEGEKIEIEKQHELDILNTQLQIQQQTMQFIGQEIHDSVAQQLTLASIYTQRMEFDNQQPHELRQLSKNLTDDKLQNADLCKLIEMECEKVNASGICTAGFIINNIPVIKTAAKSALFRIIQEFIQNSLKHSRCKGIKIEVNVENGRLLLLLEDDGNGFDVDNLKHKGIGLDSIRRRIQMLGGEYSFKSNTGKGVVLSLSIPINEAND